MNNYKTIKILNKGSYGKVYLVKNIIIKINMLIPKSINLNNINRYNKISILNEIKVLLINI